MPGKEGQPEYEDKQTAPNALDFLGQQVIISDPRFQGYGLSRFHYMDQYANKFFILSQPEGIFISPAEVPAPLIEYYDSLNIPCAAPQNRLHIERTSPEPISNYLTAQHIAQFGTRYLAPYMLSPTEVRLSQESGNPLLAELEATHSVADKIGFQTTLSSLQESIALEFGFNIAIPFAVVSAHNRSELIKSYKQINQEGRKAVVLIKPRSAAGKGIFYLEKDSDMQHVLKIIADNFDDDEDVLLEEHIQHTYSPSIQGGRTPTGNFDVFYSGAQHISVSYENGVGVNSYDSNAIPFGKHEQIDQRDLEIFSIITRLIGERLITANQIAGICGFDSVVQVDESNRFTDLKYTEANMHFPGSIAVFAAIRKLFPGGFNGLAYNQSFKYREVDDFEEFMRRNSALLIKHKGEMGVFPILANYQDKVDLIVFAHDTAHKDQIISLLSL